ncbi:tRNA pseudouridine(38-40) synthase TruA [Cellulomonas sp. Root137]|uniref:tRNA pseudouridine(38-40) synthase TruA n=1 Tax=Cellulomonas sp. Root137 TaxID=1736459 RepID=UPI000AEE2749|nr:tRNA pseudouridine(38-40) synthase TruA [Cellulomonas sp. Root137]
MSERLDPTEPPVEQPAEPAAVRLRLDLAYDGTGFAGWAIQPDLRTVQGVLEAALGTVLRTDGPPRVTVAGRTDSGVHARGQVAHVDIPGGLIERSRGRSRRPVDEVLLTRLGGILPPDLVVHALTRAPDGFDARFSALSRRYTYRICDDSARRDPLSRAHVLWHRRALDVDAMAAAAKPLVGRHDFASYCKPRPGATTIRTLEAFSWSRPVDGPDAGLVVATVRADAFCHSMVRSLVGASLAVGEGRQASGWPAELLAARRRGVGVHVVAAHGLMLDEVSYPADDELAARAVLTRARRAAEDLQHPPAAGDCCG